MRPGSLKDGQSVKFRILGSPLEGFERWTVEKKPVMVALGEAWPPGYNWREGKEGSPKLFAAVPIWNNAEDRVQVFTFTQGAIRDAIANYVAHEDYGAPTGYDLTLTRKGIAAGQTKEALSATPALPGFEGYQGGGVLTLSGVLGVAFDELSAK